MPAFQDPEIYRNILNGLQVGVSVLDLQKKIVFWSDGAEQITGYTRLDILGHACSDNVLLHCNQERCEMCDERCPISAALREAKAIEAVGFVHHKSGHRIPVHTWAIPLRDKHGSIIGVIHTFDGQFAASAPDPKQISLKQRGWLDEVTGLPNPAIMQSHLRETLGSFTELHTPFGIIVLEVPNLDEFRARYGQGAARSIVQVLSRTMRNTVWPTDLVGRWNDGRFLVILTGCSEEALQAVAARILRMMASATIMWWGEELSVKVALGGAVARTGDNLESLLQRAQAELSGRRPPQPGRAAGVAAADSSGKD